MNEVPDEPTPDQFRWAGLVRPARRVRARTLTVAAIAVALVVGILIGRELGPNVGVPASTSSPPPAALGSPQPSASGTASASPEPTSTPVLAVSGELPRPDAALPPGTPVIPRLSMVTVAEIAVSLGLTCDSARVRQGAYYWLRCEGLSAAANVRYAVSADYATLDSVSGVHVSAGPTIDASCAPS